MNKEKICYVLLIILVIGLIIDGKYSLAKYKDTLVGSVNAETATFFLSDNRNETMNLKLDDMAPGEVKEYHFNVKNYNDYNRNEVKMNYEISINKSNNLPLNIELYKNGDISNLLNESLICSNNILGFNENQSDEFVLKISWNSSNNDYQYSELTDFIDINITGNQTIS